MKTIQFYSGLKNGYETFSNFYPAPFSVTINGEKLNFPTVEHYFHFKKADLFGDINAKQQILQTKDPLAVKKIGRTVKNFDPLIWDRVAPKHLANGMYCKFMQNPDLKTQLLETQDALLQEVNPYDTKYSIGKDGTGQNLAGKCLMNVRDLIKEKKKKPANIPATSRLSPKATSCTKSTVKTSWAQALQKLFTPNILK